MWSLGVISGVFERCVHSGVCVVTDLCLCELCELWSVCFWVLCICVKCEHCGVLCVWLVVCLGELCVLFNV